MTARASGGARRQAPETWAVKAERADVAVLDIPPHAQRDRRFEIDCRFVVRRLADGDDAWHELRVEVDGALEWTRRLPIENPGGTDSLDYHFRRDVPAGRPLRVVASTQLAGGSRVALTIEAEEN